MKCMVARIFKVKTPTFIKTIKGFIEVVTPKRYEEWVTSQLDVTTMRALVTSGHTLNNFPCALYATDVTLREQNGACYRQYQNRLLAIGAEMKKRRRLNQERYRRNQHLRHQMQLDDHPVHSDFEIGSDLF
ncbi:hypothetical protein F442_00488 [Phytophthora nicotianae P10297]|uniref:Uncharacterized protein n=5 Tax=Phytophthora nicotianae TaxID=4792 RepID=W2RH18_PHYN3|nr:hypothetical protein PPTG_20731 [Phytophthora nicotianae INRA-310]ETI57145.1 hypothetical protein F443_00501 [Phytophthora nicotianae P1569]ETM03304.1 hypothetical protein L917_00449 [Phytophthora nicotianae]ETO85914.1 hypothetical protein F444_00495 [Phytophthora nicotianae P1976]ETP54891.1 hypothetical protein F442_00488 [Phytophthora nicotianae P10297]ETN23939.1 hypothetical protein PPTG_20731 [Phytophthora nicotianae INRA-310]